MPRCGKRPDVSQAEVDRAKRRKVDLANRRAARKAAHVQHVLRTRQPNARAWADMFRYLPQWEAKCAMFVGALVFCSFCGVSNMLHPNAFTTMPAPGGQVIPPYALLNPVVSWAMFDPQRPGLWHHCGRCSTEVRQQVRLQHHPSIQDDYLRALLELALARAMLLSMIDVHVSLTRKDYGFHHQHWEGTGSALVNPLLKFSWRADASADAVHANVNGLPQALLDLLQANLLYNPLYKELLCLLEVQQTIKHVQFPILPPQAVQRILSPAARRNPNMEPSAEDELPDGYMALLEMNQPMALKYHHQYMVGTKYLRTNAVAARLEPLPVVIAGAVSDVHTIESLIFPFLFPNGRGFNAGTFHLKEYLHFRANCMFSVYTLFKPYLLVSYQIHHTIKLAQVCTAVVMEAAVRKLRKKRPDICEQDTYKHLLTHHVPHTIAGSPRWHKRQLQDLLTMVDAWGLCTGCHTCS